MRICQHCGIKYTAKTKRCGRMFCSKKCKTEHQGFRQAGTSNSRGNEFIVRFPKTAFF
jgi:hypothetical protein